ncbi:MAG: hypothetical protein ABDK87_08355 [Atribacterota bacterium]
MLWRVSFLLLLLGVMCSFAFSQDFSGEASIAFAPFTEELESILESDQGTAGGIVFYYLPLKRLVVGYRVSIVEPPENSVSPGYWTRDSRYPYPVYFADYQAQYVPDTQHTTYTQANPQSLTLKGLVSGKSYHVVVTPLCIWPKSPHNLDEKGKPFLYCWLRAKTFGWVYQDGSGWGLVMASGPGGEAKRGYFEVNRVVFEGTVQAKKSSFQPGTGQESAI